MVLSLAMLLEWLAGCGAGASYAEAAALIDAAVCAAYADGGLVPYEAGGNAGTDDIMTRILDNLSAG
jgi:3-isopropylmalate dehydrogenase